MTIISYKTNPYILPEVAPGLRCEWVDMFLRRRKQSYRSAEAELSMVAVKGLRPLTPSVVSRVKQLSKKGAVLDLDSPFIGDCHVLMDVHNITPKMAKVVFAPREPGKDLPLTFMGHIVSFNRMEGSKGPYFRVEVAWVEGQPETVASHRSIKHLIRIVKNAPEAMSTPAGGE